MTDGQNCSFSTWILWGHINLVIGHSHTVFYFSTMQFVENRSYYFAGVCDVA